MLGYVGGGYLNRTRVAMNRASGVDKSIAGSFSYSFRGGSNCNISENYGDDAETGMVISIPEYLTIIGNRMKNNNTGYDFRSMQHSILIGNSSEDAVTRNFDMRDADDNQVNGNKFLGAFPSTAIFDLTGGSFNKGGHIAEMLSDPGTSPVVTLVAPPAMGGTASLFLNDGFANNEVYAHNR
jgi:hypothetical protein